MVIIYNEYQLKIESTFASFSDNDFICFSSPIVCLYQIFSYIYKKIERNSIIVVDDYVATDTNLIFLYVLTLLKCTIFYKGKEHELSFAYAIPIKRDDLIREFVYENIILCLNNKQIVFLPTDTLYLYNKIPFKGLSRIYKDERKTMKRNASTIIEEVEFSDDFFEFWKEFDKSRFNENHSISFQNFFKYVYPKMDFRLFKYSINNNLIAYNVCYFSKTEKVIYDVLFPWKNSDDAYRIGIYSMIKNLEKAYQMKWGYSMCYGIYWYKDAVLNKLKED